MAVVMVFPNLEPELWCRCRFRCRRSWRTAARIAQAQDQTDAQVAVVGIILVLSDDGHACRT